VTSSPVWSAVHAPKGAAESAGEQAARNWGCA
jgi:hypothetical protein